MADRDVPYNVWQLHEAKARFSELFRRVRAQGPQRVVKHGGEAVVVMAAEQFDEIGERATQPESLVQFFQAAPLEGATLDLRRAEAAQFPEGQKSQDPLTAARAYGIDLTLLAANLRRSPEERIRQLDAMLDFARRVRRSDV